MFLLKRWKYQEYATSFGIWIKRKGRCCRITRYTSSVIKSSVRNKTTRVGPVTEGA